MNWTPESAAELARYDCRGCGGGGFAGGEPCACVCRRVFQVCYRRFRVCAEADGFARLVTFRENRRGVERHLMWIRRNEDYCADFQASARRALSPQLYRVFRFYHLLGAAAELVARRLSISRSVLYGVVAEIEERVGRELALMQPYSLYPPRAYLGSTAHGPWRARAL
jgi:hypothetical protein